MHIFLTLAMAILCIGCTSKSLPEGGISDSDWNETTKIIYRFGDSSLPPDYHRSYTITVTEDLITVSIDSYGDELLAREFPFSAEEFQALKEKLAKSGMKKHLMKGEDGCTGGTTESVSLYKPQEKFFDAYVYHCSGDSGDLYMPAGTTELFTGLIPGGIEELIKSTRKHRE